MLGKLMKYELKATARNFLPLFAALLVFAVFNRLLYSQAVSDALYRAFWLRGVLYGIAGFVYGALICVVMVVALVVVIQRFYKNLMGDEGYLMMTLPVRSWEHVVSKMLIAGMWTVGSVIVTILSAVILTSRWSDVVYFFTDSLGEAITEVSVALAIPAPVTVIYFIFLCLAALFSGILCIYASIALGQMWKRHKVAGALVSYAVISIATQIITTIVMRIIAEFGWSDFETRLGIWLMLGISTVLLLAFGATYYFITNQILSKRLNLQ